MQTLPHAKKRKTYRTTIDPDDTLPDLPEIDPTKTTKLVQMAKDTTDINKPLSKPKTSCRSGVTDKTTWSVIRSKHTTDINKPASEENILSQSVVTDLVIDTTENAKNIINIEPVSEQPEDSTKLSQPLSAKEMEPNRDISE